jgi:hypothetical protein
VVWLHEDHQSLLGLPEATVGDFSNDVVTAFRRKLARTSLILRSCCAIERVGAITSLPVLGGRHHQYCGI